MSKSKQRWSGWAFDAAVFALVALMGFGWATCDVCAQDQELPLPAVSGVCAPEVTGTRRASLEHEGVAGFWVEGRVMRCLLGRLEAAPLYAQRVRLLEQRLHLSDERDELRQREVRLAVQGEERAVEALEAAERGKRRAEEELNAWWRHPVLWFALGGVVVGALMAVGGWAIGQLAVVL